MYGHAAAKLFSRSCQIIPAFWFLLLKKSSCRTISYCCTHLRSVIYHLKFSLITAIFSIIKLLFLPKGLPESWNHFSCPKYCLPTVNCCLEVQRQNIAMGSRFCRYPLHQDVQGFTMYSSRKWYEAEYLPFDTWTKYYPDKKLRPSIFSIFIIHMSTS